MVGQRGAEALPEKMTLETLALSSGGSGRLKTILFLVGFGTLILRRGYVEGGWESPNSGKGDSRATGGVWGDVFGGRGLYSSNVNKHGPLPSLQKKTKG